MIRGFFLIAASLLALPAAAQDAAAGRAALDRLFPPGEPACFARRYDAAHLKRLPQQSVSSVRLMRSYHQLRNDVPGDRGDGVYAELIVTYRDTGARRFLGGMSCRAGEDGAITCSSDSCDGGSFPLKIEGADAILIGGSGGRSWFTVSGGCAGGPDRSLGRGKDDTVFRLSRAPMTECR